jgi:ubiquitin-like domain-containing CTD phosphatase 1
LLKKPRDGKKLLVLDIDQTIYYESHSDNGKRSWSVRPYLYEFLTNVNEFYDIVIWSATDLYFLERKMIKMGLHPTEKFNILFYLDIEAMIAVKIPEYKDVPVRIKPLQFIWHAFPGRYSCENSLLIDDNSYNFAWATKNGLEIGEYRGNRDDRELDCLKHYLVYLAKESKDFTKVNHGKWKNYFVHHPATVKPVPNFITSLVHDNCKLN